MKKRQRSPMAAILLQLKISNALLAEFVYQRTGARIAEFPNAGMRDMSVLVKYFRALVALKMLEVTAAVEP